MSDWFAMLIPYLFFRPEPGNSYVHLIPFIRFSGIALSKASIDSDQFKAVMQHTALTHSQAHTRSIAATCLLLIEHEYRIH